MGLFEKDRPALQVDYHEKAPPATTKLRNSWQRNTGKIRMMEVQNQKGKCSNEIEFYFRPAQHLLMDISCGGSGVCGLSGAQGAQKIHKVGAGEKGKGGKCKNAWGGSETTSLEL